MAITPTPGSPLAASQAWIRSMRTDTIVAEHISEHLNDIPSRRLIAAVSEIRTILDSLAIDLNLEDPHNGK